MTHQEREKNCRKIAREAELRKRVAELEKERDAAVKTYVIQREYEELNTRLEQERDEQTAICLAADAEIDTLRAKVAELERRRSVVVGTMERSIADFTRSVEVLINDEQQKPLPDNALIGVLCDSIRLAREYCESFGFTQKVELDTLRRERDEARAALAQAEAAIIWLQHHREPTGGQGERALLAIKQALKGAKE